MFYCDHNLVGRENCDHTILDRSLNVTNFNSDLKHLNLCRNAATVSLSLHAIHSPMKRMLRALVSFTSIVLSVSPMTYKETNDKIGDESEETVGATAAG